MLFSVPNSEIPKGTNRCVLLVFGWPDEDNDNAAAMHILSAPRSIPVPERDIVCGCGFFYYENYTSEGIEEMLHEAFSVAPDMAVMFAAQDSLDYEETCLDFYLLLGTDNGNYKVDQFYSWTAPPSRLGKEKDLFAPGNSDEYKEAARKVFFSFLPEGAVPGKE